MPALAKTVVATALALALAGGAGATLAQPANAVEQHATYVTMIAWEASPDEDPEVLTGQVPCEPGMLRAAWAAFSGRPACQYEGYAYAYPAGKDAPWNGTIEWVNDSYHVDPTGGTWHVAEVVYRVAATSPEGGSHLVKAMAGELLPSQKGIGGLDANYALPLDPDVLEQDAPVVVGVGPAPAVA